MARIYATNDPTISQREMRNAQRSRQIAAQGMVLLKNNGALPIRETGKIALYGKGGRMTVKGGTGSGDVNCRNMVNIEQGLERADFEVLTKKWLDAYDNVWKQYEQQRTAKFMEAMKEGIGAALAVLFTFPKPEEPLVQEEDLVADCETAVYVLSRNSGEGVDRKPVEGDFLLSQREKENISFLAQVYKKLIIVLNVGGVVDTRFLRETKGVDAILLMSQAGIAGGDALADILTGKVTPSGHLTTTWAKRYSDYPCAETFGACNGDLDDEYYSEGIYVGYRYFDTFGVEPAYPFGFGLSYTHFDIKTESISCHRDKVEAKVRVTNVGHQYAGRAVVQLYCSCPDGLLEKPYQQLTAFAKTEELQPGESQVVELSFLLGSIASYCEKNSAYILEKGTYYIRIGAHSRDTQVVAALQMDRTVVTQQLSRRFVLETPIKEMTKTGAVSYSYPEELVQKQAATVIHVDTDSIPCAVATYRTSNPKLESAKTDYAITLQDVQNGKHTIEELVAQLTVEQMAQLCVGTARDGAGNQPSVGASSVCCPGAAGDTTSELAEERHIPNMVLADGPAGLRLVTEFMLDEQGNAVLCTPPLPIPGIAELFQKNDTANMPADAPHYYQYCTAIPIATLLAQTWDEDAIEEAGSIVGEEMLEFGVTLWLAPGMNIHRNPLCGRNFEYYSEEPLISGKCAAADTRGVQKHPGVGTTIKHFAMNNQEDNRDHVNVHAGERAIREIYLKGFEIAVKESQPLSIMSSYNLLCGVHTANSYDLLTAVAKDEWGFEGFVMTDWGTTGQDINGKHKYGSSNAAACIRAGNDLIMPGSQRDVDEIVRSVGADVGTVEYPIALADLQACAMRILSVLSHCI